MNTPTTPKTKKVVPCEIFSRIVGYYARVSNWNPGKKEEFKDRTPYSATTSLAHPPEVPTPERPALEEVPVHVAV